MGTLQGGSISLKTEGQTSDGGEHRAKLVRDEGCPAIFFQGLLALRVSILSAQNRKLLLKFVKNIVEDISF